MLRLLLLPLSGLLLALTVSAQSPIPTQPDERLYEVFEADYLQRIADNFPQQIQRMNYYLDHAWYISDFVEGKHRLDGEIDVEDVSNINIYELEKTTSSLKRSVERRMIYRIKGTNKLLIYYHTGEFLRRFRKIQAE